MSPARTARISDRQWDDVEARIKQLVHQHVPLRCKDGSRATISQILQRENNLDITVSQLEAELKEWNIAKNLRLREWKVIMPWLDELDDNGTEYKLLLAGKEIRKTTINRARRSLRASTNEDASTGSEDHISTAAIMERREISIEIREKDDWVPFKQIAAPTGATASLDEPGTQEHNGDSQPSLPDPLLFVPNSQPMPSPSYTSHLVLRAASTIRGSGHTAPESNGTPTLDSFQAALYDLQSQSGIVNANCRLNQPFSTGTVLPASGISDFWPIASSPAPGTFDFWTSLEELPLTIVASVSASQTQPSVCILFNEMPARSYDLLRDMLQHAADARMTAISGEDPLFDKDDASQLPALPEVDELADRLLGLTPREEVEDTFSRADEVADPGSTIRIAVVHSIINNFAGFDDFPMASILWALQNDAELRSELFRRLHESSAALAKTVVDNLFRATVLARDAETAKLIIEAGKGRPYAAFLEDIVCTFRGTDYNPLQLAAFLSDHKMTQDKMLIANYTTGRSSSVGDLRSLKRALLLRAYSDRTLFHSPFMYAIKNNRTEAALTLLDQGAEPIEAHLLQALVMRNKEIVESILESGINVKASRDAGQVIMEEAGKWGDVSIIRNLTFMGFDLDCDQKTTVLTEAVKLKNKELVMFLLNNGADPNKQGNGCEIGSPLCEAIGVESEEIVDLLLLNGANPADEKAFLNAGKSGIHCLTKLLRAFQKTYPLGLPGFGHESLIKAMHNNEADVLRSLLLAGFDPNSSGSNLATPLGFAIQQSSNIEFVVQLLDSGADVGRVAIIHNSSVQGHTESYLEPALLVAVRSGRGAIAHLLLDRGADINQRAHLGVKRTPLQAACEIGSWKMVNLLLQRGANVGAPPARRGGGTALQMAAKGGHIRIVQLLLSLGASVHEAPSRVLGRSALEGAAENGRLRMLDVLWTAGQSASGGFPDEEITRAIKYAKRKGHKGCADYLAWLWATKSAAITGISWEVHEFGALA
ncbi:hypothetical protein PspLS_12021 [Pyricularia sp. CBS 133598]|nr:hypothetical protein PspLS_12021 [Pyricularia sp. CBS 133598]